MENYVNNNEFMNISYIQLIEQFNKYKENYKVKENLIE